MFGLTLSQLPYRSTSAVARLTTAGTPWNRVQLGQQFPVFSDQYLGIQNIENQFEVLSRVGTSATESAININDWEAVRKKYEWCFFDPVKLPVINVDVYHA